ncbi:glucosaminidase domain-containing protein [Hydrogenophaga sp.]|uniref:glycoside hydrolase family 73 protein n=1 Tax=Hydrogenophaga sp. TaxID=1904254 RepID=UPI0025C17D95|nr:glucosaminidase domain-containing protein [Hydrogenophaga sp.]
MRLPDARFAAGTANLGVEGMAPLPRAGAGGFGALMRSVDGEVRRFIAQGSGAGLPGGLTPEAASLRLRMASATAASPATGAGVPEAERAAFLNRIAPWAENAGRALGVAPELVAAHAALESGWGLQPLRSADGSDTHNLFGLKATGGWKGGTTDALTTEFSEGEAHKTTERFRAYADPGEAFQDYARLLRDNPRYRGAINAGQDARAFAQGLAAGGYATDPAYADKLEQVARQIQGANR